MAVSELHSRLEHLVTYSSQLIFVSGDSVASQQRSLQAFVGQQSESSEIAFINAEPDFTIAQYRQQIVRQLLGSETELISRPLNELLAPLNQHDGPVMIFICEAQHLSPKFLQELWELVLQSRFAANKQHLNVLLFGEPSWTKQAKAWLPANNRDKPLLLSTESITAEEQRQQSQLDRMIAEKRKQFEKRLQDRAAANAPTESNLSTWWFRLIIVFAFLSAFAGIMLWQYSDQFSAMVNSWQEAAEEPKPMDPAAASPAITGSAISAETQSSETIDEPQEAKFEVIQSPSDTDVEKSGVQSDSDDQKLVTDWQSALQTMNTQVDATNQASTPANDPETDASQQIEDQTLAEFDEASPAYPEATGSPVDYQVEDIVTVEQLTSTATSTPQAQTAIALAASKPPEFNDEPIISEPVPAQEFAESSGESSGERSAESTVENTDIGPVDPQNSLPSPLLQLPGNQYVIQLAGISSEATLNEFLTDNRLNEQVWVYKTQRYGGDWHVVIYQQSYDSIEAARDAMLQLPEVMQRGTPFVKAVSLIQTEMQSQ